MVKTVTGILEKNFEKLLGKGIDFLKNEWGKYKVDTNEAFVNYLNNAYNKYSKIKTILYRTEPKNLYDFFEYPNLRKKDNEIIDSKDVDSLLELSHFLIVDGNGGIGKSTFMKHLFLSELEKNELIPILIELKDINSKQDNDFEIKEYIFEKLYNLNSSINEKCLEYALQSGCFLFLLDGYDEIITEKKGIFLKKITDFCDRYSENYFIISSRPYTEFLEFQRFTVLSICKFTKEQAISLISKIDYDEDLKKRFIKELEKNLYEKHESFASNPLLLNIMLLTYENYAEIPEKLHLFYNNAFETLYIKHDATKGGYKRELKSKLSSEDFKKIFSMFCFITYFKGQIEFTRDELVQILEKLKTNTLQFNVENLLFDLINSICLLYKDGLNYRFTHRSFQEYFTAVFFKDLNDEAMSKRAISFIKNDTFRASHDSVFKMLFDMAQERFEKNILLPLIKEIENNCSENKYDFYYKASELYINFYIENQQASLILTTYENKKIITFISKFIHRYRTKKIERATQENLYNYLIEHKNYQQGVLINLNEEDDDKIYELVKQTWVGDRIEILANLKTTLEKKIMKKELELDEIINSINE